MPFSTGSCCKKSVRLSIWTIALCPARQDIKMGNYIRISPPCNTHWHTAVKNPQEKRIIKWQNAKMRKIWKQWSGKNWFLASWTGADPPPKNQSRYFSTFDFRSDLLAAPDMPLASPWAQGGKIFQKKITCPPLWPFIGEKIANRPFFYQPRGGALHYGVPPHLNTQNTQNAGVIGL